MWTLIMYGIGLGLGFKVADTISRFIDKCIRNATLKRNVQQLIETKEYEKALKYILVTMTDEEIVMSRDVIQLLERMANKKLKDLAPDKEKTS